MNFFTVFLLVVAMCFSASASLIPPKQGDSQNSLVPALRQQVDVFTSPSRRLIEQLIETLRKATREAYDAVTRFSTTVQEEVTSVRERIVTDIEKMRGRVSNVIETVRNRLIDSGVSIIDCIASHSGDANVIFNETLTKTMTCVDERIVDVGDQISGLRTLSDNVVNFSNKALEDMKKCTEDRENMVATGTCLGALAIQSEMKALVFATQSALLVGRINLSIAMLTASLEVCAGSHLVDTGMATGRILMEIGTCSATSVFNAMTGNVNGVIDRNR